MKRFEVIHARSLGYFWIRDRDWKQYGMSERAISINFADTPIGARNVYQTCDNLNDEWSRFLARPDGMEPRPR